MKKFLIGTMGLFIVLSVGSAFGVTLDPMWMFTDSNHIIYQYFRYCDTARDGDYLIHALESDQIPDTGDSYDGSRYINFDYQFSSDSFYIRDEFDTSIILYRDWRPGFAGFKTAWDYGMSGFPLARYTYFVFAHKGPNPNHKVTVRCWYNDGGCGSPSFNELVGTFAASETWKVDTLVIPDTIQNKPDRERNFNKYYEFVFIINNIDSNDTTSGPPGYLRIDEMRLVGCNPIDTSPKPQEVNEDDSATFQVYTSRVDSTDILTYQWKKDGVDIAGANDSVYTITSVTADHVGVYTVAVTVSSTGLTFTSQGAKLTLITDIIWKNTHHQSVSKGTFIPSTSGPVKISVFSLSGKLLSSTRVDVVAGKKYAVDSFIKTHVPLSPLFVRYIKIKGAGIDILKKVL